MRALARDADVSPHHHTEECRKLPQVLLKDEGHVARIDAINHGVDDDNSWSVQCGIVLPRRRPKPQRVVEPQLAKPGRAIIRKLVPPINPFGCACRALLIRLIKKFLRLRKRKVGGARGSNTDVDWAASLSFPDNGQLLFAGATVVDRQGPAVFSGLKLLNATAAPATLAALGRYVTHPRVCLVSLRDLKLNGPIALLKATVLDFHHAARPIGDHNCRAGLRFCHFCHFSTPDSMGGDDPTGDLPGGALIILHSSPAMSLGSSDRYLSQFATRHLFMGSVRVR
jgi:hypothetical protein